MATFEKVFEPLTINKLTIPNRIIMSPMVTHYATDNGTVTQRNIDYYVERAKGGIGLITVEATFVDMSSLEYHMLGIYDDKLIPGLRKLTDAVHAAGGRLSIQIIHKGRLAKTATTFMKPMSASYINDMGDVPREITEEEIRGLVDKFAQAARRAKEAGFDAVELHMAHGYILNQFMSPYANKRTDGYGGSVEGRARFAKEVVEAVRQAVGPDFPVTAKINATDRVSGGLEPEDWKTILPILEKAGLDAVNVSGGIAETTYLMTAPMGVPRAFNLENAKKIKSYTKLPVGVVGRIPTIQLAEEILESGAVDFITMGRSTLADPYFVNKAKAGDLDGIRPCINCNQGCVGRTDVFLDICCLANPIAGREGQVDMSKVEDPKKVLVIGGGPAGMEAAGTAARKGHKVTLLEERDVLGGQLYLAGIPPLKSEVSRLVTFLEHYCRSNGVEIVMGHKAVEADLETYAPDVVIMASGGTPLRLPIPGLEKCPVAEDVLTGKYKVKSPCCVIGGGSVGCETADLIAEQGVEVTIVEMMPSVCRDQEKRQRRLQLLKLIDAGANILTEAKCLEIGDGYVDYECHGINERVGGFKDIISAVGYRAKIEEGLLAACEEKKIRVLSVGDCNQKARNALPAIREGFEAAMKI